MYRLDAEIFRYYFLSRSVEPAVTCYEHSQMARSNRAVQCLSPKVAAASGALMSKLHKQLPPELPSSCIMAAVCPPTPTVQLLLDARVSTGGTRQARHNSGGRKEAHSPSFCAHTFLCVKFRSLHFSAEFSKRYCPRTRSHACGQRNSMNKIHSSAHTIVGAASSIQQTGASMNLPHTTAGHWPAPTGA
jgi:hypothetical protein